jgi:hypothetical protein
MYFPVKAVLAFTAAAAFITVNAAVIPRRGYNVSEARYYRDTAREVANEVAQQVAREIVKDIVRDLPDEALVRTYRRMHSRDFRRRGSDNDD